jgi:hypothetical protein
MSDKQRRSPTRPRQKKPSRSLAHIDPEALAAQQGIKPVHDPMELRGDFWPENESTDDFIAWLRKLRREG